MTLPANYEELRCWAEYKRYIYFLKLGLVQPWHPLFPVGLVEPWRPS